MAQTGNPYNGNWSATWQGTKGLVQHGNRADVVIHDNGGTFQNQQFSTRNPCVGKKAPITVKTATADELVFVIEFSTVLRGCEDSEVRLKRVDDRTLKGFRDGEREITLVRE
jgi:hypothetical protein